MFPGAQMGLKAKTLVLGEDVYQVSFPDMRWAELYIDDKETVHVGAQAPISVDFELCFATIKANAAAANAPRYYLLNNENWMTLIIWVPEGVKISEKFKYTHSVSQVKEIFAGEWKEFRPEGMEEFTFKHWYETTRDMTAEEREGAMTVRERQLMDVKKAEDAARAAAPTMLPGMNTMEVNLSKDIREAVLGGKTTKGDVVMMKIEGTEDLELICPKMNVGKDVAGIFSKLPADQPAYVLYHAMDDQYDLLVWVPDSAPAKYKMKVSTLRAGCLSSLGKHNIEAVATDLNDEGDLKDFQNNGRPAKGGGDGSGAGGEAAPARKLPAGVPKGAVMIPGMGMGMPLPGMGKK